MLFGMKNSPATFQRLINIIITGLDNCKPYIDESIIYSEEWDQQIKTIREFFERLSEAKLKINLAKNECCHATLTFLGHVNGQGQVKPVEAKVKAISDFPVPTCKIQLMRFLCMAGYYRKFCDNFSVIAEPLTNLLSKRTKFIWTNDCQKAFDILKAILKNEPVLIAPNFAKEFKLAVDASDTGAGSVSMQEDGNGVDHPVSYFSKKFNKHQKNYSTIEKECLSLILALQHFEVYLTSSPSPIVVFSDHNPLIFIHEKQESAVTQMEPVITGILSWHQAHQRERQYSTAIVKFRFVSGLGDNLSRWQNLMSRCTVDLSRWHVSLSRFRCFVSLARRYTIETQSDIYCMIT